MAVTNFLTQADIVLTGKPIERPPSDFGEVVKLSFANARANFNTDSRSRMLGQAEDQNRQAFEKALGREVKPEDAEGFQPFTEPDNNTGSIAAGTKLSPDDIERQREDHNRKAIFRAIQEHKLREPERFREVKSDEEVVEAAREKARMTQAEFEAAAARSGSLTRTIAPFVGGLAGTATDPVNLLMLPFGAGAGASILKTIAVEAALGAAGELAVVPSVASWQKEIGNEYGLSEIAENVAFGAVFGAGFGALSKGAKPAASWAFARASEAPQLFKKVERTSLSYLSRVAHFKENIPYLRSKKISDKARHQKDIDTTSKAMIEDRPLATEELSISEGEFLSIDTSKKRGDGALVRTAADEIEATRGPDELTAAQVASARPKYTMETLPQKLIENVLERETTIADNLFSAEVQMLEAVGIKPGRGGKIPQQKLKAELARREKSGELIDTKLAKSDHVAAHISQFSENIQKLKKPRPEPDAEASGSITAPLDKAIKEARGPETSTTLREGLREVRSKQEVDAARELDFERLVNESPELEVMLEREGDSVKVKELIKEFDTDEKALEAMKTCGVKG